MYHVLLGVTLGVITVLLALIVTSYYLVVTSNFEDEGDEQKIAEDLPDSPLDWM